MSSRIFKNWLQSWRQKVWKFSHNFKARWLIMVFPLKWLISEYRTLVQKSKKTALMAPHPLLLVNLQGVTSSSHLTSLSQLLWLLFASVGFYPLPCNVLLATRCFHLRSCLQLPCGCESMSRVAVFLVFRPYHLFQIWLCHRVH